jgi:hypothetical protein
MVGAQRQHVRWIIAVAALAKRLDVVHVLGRGDPAIEPTVGAQRLALELALAGVTPLAGAAA